MSEIKDWTEERISKVSDKEASEFIKHIVRSPYLNGYIAVKTTIDNLNEELINGAAKINEGTTEHDKAFERSHKYITEMQPYYEQLEYFRQRLLPQEKEEVERAADLLDEARLVIKKNGKI